MQIKMYVKNCVSGSGTNVSFEEDDLCPRCHRPIVPEYLGGAFYQSGFQHYLSVFNLCRGCMSVYISTYMAFPSCNDSNLYNCQFQKSEPISPNQSEFKDSIKTVSSKFVEIYNQAEAAESMGLSEIAGTGYRKALEFLIKDFLISENPERESEIKDEPLSKCIKKLGYNDLQIVASRAAWLGNDETHYYKKHDKDIEDLKQMIGLTVNWINLIIGTRKALDITPK